jgi:hypothetical protein
MIITVAVASSSSYAAVTDQDPSSSFLSIPTTTNFGVKTQNLILSVGEKKFVLDQLRSSRMQKRKL